MNANWSKLQDVFEDAWPLDESARRALLDSQCRGDDGLRAEVETMLRAYDEDRNTVAQPAARGKKFGVWETSELLGRGGMAEVYMAHRADGNHEQRAALKVMSRYLATPEYIDRFRRERQILARMEHPNIARLLDGGVSKEGEPYLVMEYIDGNQLDDCGTLTTRHRLELMRSLCSAVESAHRNLILHRDIKPSNVLVTPDGTVKLLDFGTAGKVDADSLKTSAPLTPAYASPEQLRGDPVTTLSDVYSLGATLYRLLAGIAPFGGEGKGPWEVVSDVLDADPPLPSKSAALATAGRLELRGDLDNIVRKAMHKDPGRRYSSPERLSEDIERYLEKRPIQARPLTWPYRTERFVARNRLGVAFAGAVFIILAAAAGSLGWQIHLVRLQSQHNASLVDFLTRVLGLRWDTEGGPLRATGGATRMMDVVADAAQQLHAQVSGQPELEASLDAEIGHTLAEFGDRNKAEQILRNGLSLVDRKKNPALAGMLMGYLARDRQLQGMVRQPVVELDEAMRLVHLSPAPIPPATEANLLNYLLAGMSERNGLTPEAEKMSRRMLELGREVGEASPIYAAAVVNLSGVFRTHGRFDEAEKTLQDAARIYRKMPFVPLDYQMIPWSLAVIRIQQGRLAEAGPLLDQALATVETGRGRDTVGYQSIRVWQGRLLFLKGDYRAAAAQLQEVQREIETLLPKAKSLKTAALYWRASALLKMNRAGEAGSLLREALQLAHDDFDDDSPRVRLLMDAIGHLPG